MTKFKKAAALFLALSVLSSSFGFAGGSAWSTAKTSTTSTATKTAAPVTTTSTLK